AIVGDGDRAGFHHLADERKALAVQPDRYGTDWIDARMARAQPFCTDEADGGGIIHGRIRIRHRAHGREPARERGARAARDRLLVLAAGFTQVHVYVDETGTHHHAGYVQHLRVVRPGDAAADCLDDAVRQQYIRDV